MRKSFLKWFAFLLSLHMVTANLVSVTYAAQPDAYETQYIETAESMESTPLDGEISEVEPGSDESASLDAKQPKVPTISAKKLYVVVNKTAKLSVKNVKAANVVWTIENPEICSIAKGKVKGLSYGVTKVTAAIDGYEGEPLECTVVVQNPVRKLAISSDVNMIYCRDSLEAEAQSQNIANMSLKDGDGNVIDNSMVKWKVAKAAYASIDTGIVTSNIKKATVTVSASYGGKKAKKKILILPKEYYTGEPVDASNPTTAQFADADLAAEISRDIYSQKPGSSIYVSPNGDDNGSGTKSSPYKSVQKALNEAEAGDTILLRSGEYEGLLEFQESGRKGKYITLCSAQGETAVLVGKNGKNGAVLRLNDCTHIRIENLEIKGHTAVQSYGILMDGEENHVVIKNNHIHNLATTKPNRGGECNGILLIGYEPGDDHAIHDIWIERNELDHNTTGWSECLSTSANCRNVNVIGNTVHDNTNIGIDFYGNAKYCSSPAYDQPRFCIARDNNVYNNKCGYAECAGIYVDGSRDILIVNNIVKDNMYGIEVGSEEPPGYFPVKNIHVLQNQVSGNTCGGIRIGGFDTKRTGVVRDCVIGENVLKDNGAGEGGYNGEINIEKCDHILFRNNTVKQSNDEYPAIGEELAAKYVTNITFENNTYMQPEPSNIYFEYHKKVFTGVDRFNAYTGGTDVAKKLK